MSPEEQQNAPTSPDNERGSVPDAQPGTMYQPSPLQPEVPQPATPSPTPAVTPAMPPDQPQPQPTPSPISNPFANQPFLNQPVPGQPVTAGVAPVSAPDPNQEKPDDTIEKQVARAKTARRLWIALGISSVLLIILGLAYLFLVYIPDMPQNVWQTGLNRSGKAMTTISGDLTQKEGLDVIKKSEVNATLTATKGRSNYDGEAHITYDSTNIKGDIKLTQKNDGQADKVFTNTFMSQAQDNAQFPTLYMQFTGLKTIGIGDILPGLLTYENKWLVVNDAYIKSLGVSPDQVKQLKDNQVTSQDVSQALEIAIDTSAEYMLTTNPKKAVFEQRKFLRKERVDGKTTYHYVVAINKQHAKDYCAALATNLSQTQLYKKYDPKGTGSQKDSIMKTCQDYVENNIHTNDTFDMWIEAHYKLIYRLRFTDKQDKNSYRDIGQYYHGGSSIQFFATSHNAASRQDTGFVLETNFKTHDTKGAITAVSTGSSPYTLKVVWEAKPYTGEIKIDKPAAVVPIQDVFKAINLDPTMFGKPSGKNAQDTERQADIRTLGANMEEYFSTSHRYPTLVNLNDTKWLKGNMPGLDVAALKDPENSSSALVSTPTAKTYAYQAKAKDGSACDNVKKDCTTYTLIATLSDSTTYVKQSLN